MTGSNDDTSPGVPEETVTIDPRFRGPPGAGNGGYCCGLLARQLQGCVAVTLRRPAPLGQPLSIIGAGQVRLHDGDQLIAEARQTTLDGPLPVAPTLAEAEAMSAHYAGFEQHAFGHCFVCGPRRPPGDGLRIFAGRRGDAGPVAAPWTPDDSLGPSGSALDPIYVWSALDCPGYFAVAGRDEYALLGRMTAEIVRGLVVGEPVVVVGWPIGRVGRKLSSGTAIFGVDGALRARSLQTWIVPASGPKSPHPDGSPRAKKTS